jgi:hypothetical protein
MAANAKRIGALVEGVAAEQARWRPSAEKWSILEVINHLYDEEQYDFRVRLDMILHHPERPWPGIDPQGWVSERDYNGRALDVSLQDFMQERAVSLDWLRSLQQPDWEATYETRFGPIRAGSMMAAWVAHDLLHARQLVGLHWAWTVDQLAPYDTLYAGEWQR